MYIHVVVRSKNNIIHVCVIVHIYCSKIVHVYCSTRITLMIFITKSHAKNKFICIVVHV